LLVDQEREEAETPFIPLPLHEEGKGKRVGSYVRVARDLYFVGKKKKGPSSLSEGNEWRKSIMTNPSRGERRKLGSVLPASSRKKREEKRRQYLLSLRRGKRGK